MISTEKTETHELYYGRLGESIAEAISDADPEEHLPWRDFLAPRNYYRKLARAAMEAVRDHLKLYHAEGVGDMWDALDEIEDALKGRNAT